MEKKGEEMERGMSELRLGMEELCLFSSGEAEEQQEQKQQRSSTMDLLCVSKQLLHVLDEIGPTLLVLRQDIQQNVQRLQDLHARDPSKYSNLTAIVTEEAEEQQEQKQQRSSTMDLLCVSKQLLHVLDEIGPTLLVLRQDIQQNVQRLQDLHARDPSKYSNLTAIVTEEAEEGTSKKTNSCTRAIIWLARSINFSRHLLERLLKDPNSSLKEIVEEAYKSTLKPWHGWISSAAYRVAESLIPEREIFIALLMGNCQDFEDFAADVKIVVSIVQPLLEEINAVLVKHQLDKMKST